MLMGCGYVYATNIPSHCVIKCLTFSWRNFRVPSTGSVVAV